MQGLRVTEQGWLMLEEGASEGIYTTQEVETIPFENLVACWNADTPEGSWVEVSARIYLQEKKTWSPWGSWGRWSPYIERRNRSGEYPVDDPLIRMNCDILEPLCGAGTKLQLPSASGSGGRSGLTAPAPPYRIAAKPQPAGNPDGRIRGRRYAGGKDSGGTRLFADGPGSRDWEYYLQSGRR